MAGAAVYTIYAGVVVIGRLPRLRWSTPTRSEGLGIRFGIILVIAANWAYLIWCGV
jgi:hypothetical protein